MAAGNYSISATALVGFAAFPFSFTIHVINTAFSPLLIALRRVREGKIHLLFIFRYVSGA
jgi:hypothetical protein